MSLAYVFLMLPPVHEDFKGRKADGQRTARHLFRSRQSDECGNLVHNLHTYAWGGHPRDPYDWAVRFESTVRQMILAGENKPLINYEMLGKDAVLSIPTPDHYLPLPYVLAARQSNENIRFPVEGVDGGSILMLSVQIG